MGNIKQINIENRTHFFFNDMVNIKDFDLSLIKIEKKIVQKYCYLLHWIHHKKKDKY